jgi:hypothetical protein
MPDVSFFNQFTPGAVGIWSFFGVFVVALIKSWPAIKAKVNEAHKIQLDADGDLRGDLLTRIGELETQVRSERQAGDDRHAACERELAAVRARLDGVVRQFLAFQIATARAIPLTRSPEMSQALDTLKGFLEPGKEGTGK